MADQLEAGRLAIGRPFVDDSGRMMPLRADSPEAALAIAETQPSETASSSSR